MFKSIIKPIVLLSALWCTTVSSAAEFAKPVIEIADANELKGIKKVAVASFTVQYVLEQVWDTSHYVNGQFNITGQGGGFNAASLLEPAKMQSTTEMIYKDFMANLKATGLEVVSPEQLSASKAYQAFVVKAPPTPRKEEAEAQSSNGAGAITSVFYTPSGVPLAIDDDMEYLKEGMMSTVGDPTLTFTGRLGLYATNLPYYDEKVQDELGVATLHVRIYVPLAKVKVATGNILGQGYSSKTIEPGLRLGERFTRIAVGNDGDYAVMYLKEPLMIPGVIDPKVEEVAHPNPIRAMLGETYKVYPATMDANAYWKLMPEATTYTLKAFATKLKEGI